MKAGEKLVNMVSSPYGWYFNSDFRNFESLGTYKKMLDDPHNIMLVNGSEDAGFFGGYILGFTLRERMGTSEILKLKPKSYTYLDAFRVARSLEIFPDEFPESISPPKQKKRPFIEKVQFGDELLFRIFVGSLAYASIQTVVQKPIGEYSLRELIEKYRATQREAFREEFMREKTGDETVTMVNYMFKGVQHREDSEDVYDSGRKGVAEAFRRFDLTLTNIQVETYVMNNVRWEVIRYFNEEGRIPKSLSRTINLVRPFVTKSSEDGVPLNTESVAQQLGISEDSVEAAYRQIISGGRQLSLDYPTNPGENRETPFSAIRKDNTSFARDPLDIAADRDFIAYVFSCLEPHEREWLIKHRLNGKTLTDLGVDAGVSRSRVGQLIGKGLDDKLERLWQEYVE